MKLELYVDAKASAGKFGICDKNGDVIWYGKFFEDEDADQQWTAERAAAKKAVWLASKVREALKLNSLDFTLYVDAEWLCYQQHAKQKGYILTFLAKKYNLNLTVKWIDGKSNPADKWTTAPGFAKWQDCDLLNLITNEFTANSTVDVGTGLPSGNQEQLQSDSEVQQGDKGQGSGNSDDRKQSGSDGERATDDTIRTRPATDS